LNNLCPVCKKKVSLWVIRDKNGIRRFWWVYFKEKGW
jgi:uncharacterized protein YbaR (Trm112 family)